MKTGIILCSSLEIICMTFMLIIMSNKEKIPQTVMDTLIIVIGIIMLAVLITLGVITIKSKFKK